MHMRARVPVGLNRRESEGNRKCIGMYKSNNWDDG